MCVVVVVVVVRRGVGRRGVCVEVASVGGELGGGPCCSRHSSSSLPLHVRSVFPTVKSYLSMFWLDRCFFH